MARIDVSQDEVIESIVLRLRTLHTLGERQCYETIEPLSPAIVPPGGDFWLTVSPGGGQFDESMQIGGGQSQLMEDAEVIVTGYSRVRLDSTDHDAKLLRDASRGLLVVKKKILQLVADDLVLPAPSTDVFLRQFVVARSATAPQYDSDKSIGWLSIYFGISYDWDLS